MARQMSVQTSAGSLEVHSGEAVRLNLTADSSHLGGRRQGHQAHAALLSLAGGIVLRGRGVHKALLLPLQGLLQSCELLVGDHQLVQLQHWQACRGSQQQCVCLEQGMVSPRRVTRCRSPRQAQAWLLLQMLQQVQARQRMVAESLSAD